MANERNNVLLVDDEASFRRVLKTSLSALGYGTEESRNGEEALELLHRRSFDLILLDINMPGIGGVQTCREIRARTFDVGVVMVSVWDGENDLVQALDAGADDYITKPVRFLELLARLGAVLRRIRPDNNGEPEVLRVGELELDMRRHVLRRNGAPVHLTPRFALFISFHCIVAIEARIGTSQNRAHGLGKPGLPGYPRKALALHLGTRVRLRA